MTKFSPAQKIGDIVTTFPKAADVFKEYKIDFCCGGDRPLSKALVEQGLDEKEVINKLESLYQELSATSKGDIAWTRENLSKFIDHIILTHHTYLQAELPRISELTTKILRAHRANHPELTKVH
ncbi:MAG: DUF542 domain-containing protein [Desulfitobacterium hafniense]|nr:DUF542 domain-containing protein [Desulfitobacterium hafniense]